MAFAFVRSRIFSSKIFSPVARSLAKPKYEQCMNDLFYTYLFLTTDFYRQLWTNQGPWNYYNDYIIHRKCSWHLYSWTRVFSFIPGKNNLSRWSCIRSTCIIPILSTCTTKCKIRNSCLTVPLTWRYFYLNRVWETAQYGHRFSNFVLSIKVPQVLLPHIIILSQHSRCRYS